ncbi:MAG: hypothetical protein PHU23_08705 [Dehalococcoidales bacterium]|nr:hypothetical protein [Dehalococcoidales bacterium]
MAVISEKPIYYYIRYMSQKPQKGALLATVCLVPKTDVTEIIWHRGVALCSVKDQFSRKIGRKIAYGRALQAMEHRGHVKPVIEINTFAAEALRMLAPYIHYLSEPAPLLELDPHEKYLISKLDEKKQ